MPSLSKVQVAGMTLPKPEPPALHDRAIQDLSYIRRAMEGAASFTDVPGRGLVVIGALGLLAAATAARQSSAEAWLAVWLCTAALAGTVGVATMLHKMRRRIRAGSAFHLSAPARKFIFGFWPALFAGAVLTGALVDPRVPGLPAGLTEQVLPGLWLLLYGVGIMTAGAHAIRAIPMMGAGFIALGTLTLFLPVDGNLMMACGFGALHLGFGVYVARRHDG